MVSLSRLIGQKRLAILEACVIGLVSGLAAVALKQGVEGLTAWRLGLPLPAWVVLPGLGAIGGYLAGWIGEGCPPTAGSGVPQVKAALSYVPIPLNLRVAILKLISSTLALGAGLSLGRQGPTVQIGAALAAQLSRWVPTSPDYRRQVIAAGAAAGLAAGFNAPIAGVLFVVEELLQDFSGLTLGSAILASFVGAVVSRLLGGQGLNLSEIALSQTGLSVQDLPFLALLGILAGVLGSLFSRGIFVSLGLFRQLPYLRLAWRVALAGGMTGLVGVVSQVAAQDNTELREFLVTGTAPWNTIALAFGLKFLLTLLAYGSGAPGGIFAPALVLGSALGCLVSFMAQASHSWLGLVTDTLASGNTTTYALTGMGAFFSATTRVPITAIVIVFEMTANFNLVLPLMIGSGIAYLIADRINTGSLYTALLTFQGIDLGPNPAARNPWETLTAADLMQRRVETLAAELPLADALAAFSRSHHRGFPVLRQGRLVGIVTQSDIAQASTSPGSQGTLATVMTPHPVTVTPETSLPQVLQLLTQLKISRLPVMDGSKLVGIITRADIIRAETERLEGGGDGGAAVIPSYGVYRTRSPALGKGRILVPLADPDSAPRLLAMAAAIAHVQDYELECVHVIAIPIDVQPCEAVVDLTPGRALLQQAEQLAQRQGLCLHTQIRVGHDVARALLEVIRTRHISLLLMGCRGRPTAPGGMLGNIVDTLLRRAPCTVMVVRSGPQARWDRWLLPLGGGPNARLALTFLPAFVKLAEQPAIYLCSVLTDGQDLEQRQGHLREAAQRLEGAVGFPIHTRLLQTTQITQGILALARRSRTDVIFLGASREGLLSQVLHGNVPLAIAQTSPTTVILLRQPLPDPRGTPTANGKDAIF